MEETIEKLKQLARESWRGETGEVRATALEKFLRELLAEYSAKLGLAEADILAAIEKRRDYCAVNYYKRANFPSLDDVRIFETVNDLRAAVATKQFRCPRCGGVSSDPYRCNSGQEMEPGAVCDWAAFGFFRTMGKGLRFTVRDTFLEHGNIDECFMPLSLESPVANEQVQQP